MPAEKPGGIVECTAVVLCGLTGLVVPGRVLTTEADSSGVRRSDLILFFWLLGAPSVVLTC